MQSEDNQYDLFLNLETGNLFESIDITMKIKADDSMIKTPIFFNKMLSWMSTFQLFTTILTFFYLKRKPNKSIHVSSNNYNGLDVITMHDLQLDMEYVFNADNNSNLH